MYQTTKNATANIVEKTSTMSKNVYATVESKVKDPEF